MSYSTRWSSVINGGAEIQISSLIVRRRVPTRIAIGTGIVASAVALASATALAKGGHRVEWPLAAVAIPATVIDL